MQVIVNALRNGGGRMAQFGHADFGGMSQWSPGMSMVGDMFNKRLQSKLDALCTDIAAVVQELREGVCDDAVIHGRGKKTLLRVSRELRPSLQRRIFHPAAPSVGVLAADIHSSSCHS